MRRYEADRSLLAMRRREARRVLVIAPGELDEHLAGPEIRAVSFAKALSDDFDVTIAAQRSGHAEHEGIRVVPASRRRLIQEAARHDVIISACLAPYLLASRRVHDFIAITDQYDPLEHVFATLRDSRSRRRELRAHAAIRALQLRHSDAVLCATARQRVELLRLAAETLSHRVPWPDPVVIPFGISDPPPLSQRTPLRDRFPEIAPSDTLVLWWGSVWRWLDAETAIRAFAHIAKTRSDVKLVITAGRRPGSSAERMFETAEEMRTLAARLGVLERSVFFLDAWIPYSERHDYLREADIGLTLHRHAEEARLAARSRYMDYLSAELPCVLGRGDETAEEFGDSGFATLLENPGHEAVAEALLRLADDPRALAAARACGHRLAIERRFSAVEEKLRIAVSDALSASHSSARRLASLDLVGGVGGYYARRLVDRLVATV